MVLLDKNICFPEGEEYASLKETILSSSALRAAGLAGSDVAKVMAVFSTSFLSHFNSQDMPLARQLTFPQHLMSLVEAMLQNFPRSREWQVNQTSTAEFIFMIRPIIHMAAMSSENSFWRQLSTSPNRLQEILWPFMPEDENAAALAALTERVGFYTCQCGFQYAVGECTQPMQEVRCPRCRRAIGGQNHQSSAGNVRLQDHQLRGRAMPGFLDTRDEDDRQTCRSLTVYETRSGRYFVHGLLSLVSSLNPGVVRGVNLSLGLNSGCLCQTCSRFATMESMCICGFLTKFEKSPTKQAMGAKGSAQKAAKSQTRWARKILGSAAKFEASEVFCRAYDADEEGLAGLATPWKLWIWASLRTVPWPKSNGGKPCEYQSK